MAVPLSVPCCGSRVDGEVNSLCADGTGMGDADEGGRRAVKNLPSMDKHQDCDRLTCRVLLSNNQFLKIRLYCKIQKDNKGIRLCKVSFTSSIHQIQKRIAKTTIKIYRTIKVTFHSYAITNAYCQKVTLNETRLLFMYVSHNFFRS